MKTIKFHLTLDPMSYSLKSIGFYSPIICPSFVQDCLNATPQNITLWVVPSKNGHIVIGKPIYRIEWVYKILGWKWCGQRALQPLLIGLGERLNPGRYNVYMSEGWV